MAAIRLVSGLIELDAILRGGFVRFNSYLVRGGPGSGKTTLGMHFCAAGKGVRERALFITLGQAESRLREDAEVLGIDMTGVEFLDLTPSPQAFAESDSYDIFTPADIEREPTTRLIIDAMNRLKPHRVFVDAITHFRYLSTDVFEYRRQVMSLLRFLCEEKATVLVSSESSADLRDDDLQYLADGVIELVNDGAVRSLRVSKCRGTDFLPGHHGMRLRGAGIELYRRLQPEAYLRPFEPLPQPTGIAGFDAMLHGGLERGTVTYLFGPSGAGKSTVAAMVGLAAARRGERSVFFSFEENGDIFAHHMRQLGVDLESEDLKERFVFRKIHPGDLSTEEFAQRVQVEVEQNGATQIVLDSVAGYRISLRSHESVAQLHTLCKYLTNVGCSAMLVGEYEGRRAAPGGTEGVGIGVVTSYIADTVVEIVRRTSVEGTETGVRVLKKRLSSFNRLTHEFEVVPGEPIVIGPPWQARP